MAKNKAKAKKLKIVQFGHPALRAKTRKLSKAEIASVEIKNLVAKMFATMDKIGVGLAAPQIGQSLQLAVIEIKPTANRPDVESFPKTVVINPQIISYGPKTDKWEACLSLNGVWGKAQRSQWVEVKYTDLQGRVHQQKYTDFPAHVFQHEIDHLNSTLFVDRVRDSRTLVSMEELDRYTN